MTLYRKYALDVFIALMFALIVAACVVTEVGCAAQNPPPLQPKTPLQWIAVYNAALAKANRAFEGGVEALAAGGTISNAQARPALLVSQQVATASQAIAKALENATEANFAASIAPQVAAILQQLGANTLLEKQGITAPQLQQLYAAITAVTVLIEQEVKP